MLMPSINWQALFGLHIGTDKNPFPKRSKCTAIQNLNGAAKECHCSSRFLKANQLKVHKENKTNTKVKQTLAMHRVYELHKLW